MHTSQNFGRSWRILVAIALCSLFIPSGFASNAGEVTDTNSSSSETLRSYLQLQEQLRATQLALEHNRQETETLAAKNAEAVAARFKTIEDALSAKRADEIESMKSSMASNNRMLITVAGVIAGVGFMVLLLTAYLQWRSVSRLAEFSAMVQGARAALPPGPVEAQLLGAGDVTQSGGRLASALSHLEKRILELEHTAHTSVETKVIAAGAHVPAAPNGVTGENGHHEQMAHDAVLLAKGESLLNLDKAAEALECFEEILRAEPDHAEALVKKGLALEDLRRLEEALLCYDRAIAINGELTIAYLQKGGLFNRMERYEEALMCYEQALHAQEKVHASVS
jgi:tetratricopeptide (TPR) repeat protein